MVFDWTPLSLSLSQDLGYYNNNIDTFEKFYSMDYNYVDKLLFGYNQGCDPVPLSCSKLSTSLSVEDQQFVGCSSFCMYSGTSPEDEGGFAVPLTLQGAIALAPTLVSGAGHSLHNVPEEERVQPSLFIQDITITLIGWVLMFGSAYKRQKT